MPLLDLNNKHLPFWAKIAVGDVRKIYINQTIADEICLFLHIRSKIDAGEGTRSLITIAFIV